MNKNKVFQKYFYLIAALILAGTIFLTGMTDFIRAGESVREEVLRLHIIANSDSEADQEVKLRVRDAILQAGAAVFDGSVSAKEAEIKITPEMDHITARAEEILRENGFSYGAAAELSYEFFDTRAYGDVTLPAGNYRAVKIILGEGKGKNWWCVMFPPLCLPAAAQSEEAALAVFSPEEMHVIKPAGTYKVKFKIAEILQKLSEKLKRQ